MSRGRKLTDEQALELFEMSRKGFSNEEMAKKFGISTQTVGTYCRRVMRDRLRQQGSGPRTVVESDGATLTFSVEGGYVGRMTVNDVEETCVFKAKVDSDAKKEFIRWIGEMKAEEEFMAKVTRKQESVVARDTNNDIYPKKDTIYSIVLKDNVGKIYGHYFDFDAAVEEMDRMNDVAMLLVGKDDAFDMVEAPLRG